MPPSGSTPGWNASRCSRARRRPSPNLNPLLPQTPGRNRAIGSAPTTSKEECYATEQEAHQKSRTPPPPNSPQCRASMERGARDEAGARKSATSPSTQAPSIGAFVFWETRILLTQNLVCARTGGSREHGMGQAHTNRASGYFR